MLGSGQCTRSRRRGRGDIPGGLRSPLPGSPAGGWQVTPASPPRRERAAGRRRPPAGLPASPGAAQREARGPPAGPGATQLLREEPQPARALSASSRTRPSGERCSGAGRARPPGEGGEARALLAAKSRGNQRACPSRAEGEEAGQQPAGCWRPAAGSGRCCRGPATWSTHVRMGLVSQVFGGEGIVPLRKSFLHFSSFGLTEDFPLRFLSCAL